MPGLHDISPTVAKPWVTSAVRAPIRAAAAAASQPAWPPPTTTMSKLEVAVSGIAPGWAADTWGGAEISERGERRQNSWCSTADLSQLDREFSLVKARL